MIYSLHVFSLTRLLNSLSFCLFYLFRYIYISFPFIFRAILNYIHVCTSTVQKTWLGLSLFLSPLSSSSLLSMYVLIHGEVKDVGQVSSVSLSLSLIFFFFFLSLQECSHTHIYYMFCIKIKDQIDLALYLSLTAFIYISSEAQRHFSL